MLIHRITLAWGISCGSPAGVPEQNDHPQAVRKGLTPVPDGASILQKWPKHADRPVVPYSEMSKSTTRLGALFLALSTACISKRYGPGFKSLTLTFSPMGITGFPFWTKSSAR